MRAIRYSSFGAAEVLEQVEMDRPSAGEGQVVVRALAAGVNPLDWKLREGHYRRVFRRRLPFVPGVDVCGEVVEVGSGATRFQAGERVCGFVDARKGGGYAEFVALDAAAAAAVPDGVTDEEAAALPCVGLTALQAVDQVDLNEESRVLVIGAAGGVGHLGVRIAKARNARVNGVCGPDSVEWVQQLEPNRVIDYSVDRYLEEATSYDLIFDAVAVQSYRACKPILKRGGTYLTTLLSPGIAAAMILTRIGFKGRAGLVICRSDGDDLRSLLKMASEGIARPRVESVFDLSEARQAHRLSETGHARGKIVLRITGREA